MSPRIATPATVDPCREAQARSRLLEDLVRRHSGALTSFFRRRVARKSDVPDLVQDVFLRLARLENLSTIEKPQHYLFAAAASALSDRARRDITRQGSHHVPFDESMDGATDLSPERVLLGRQALQRLQAALAELPERTRDVFVLRALEEQRMAKVALTVGVSVRAAEKHYAKAMAFLTARLRDDDA